MVTTINDENKNTLYAPKTCQGCPECYGLKAKLRRMEEELSQLRAFAVLKNSQ